jgi:RNA polymerase sigma-70 factor, ECF subfamily
LRSKPTDEQLMVAHQQGEPRAFETLVDRHSSRVRRWVYVKSKQTTADLVQQVFLNLHRGVLRFKPSLPFLPWLKTIARNVLLSHLRRHRPVFVDLDDLQLGGDPVAQLDDQLDARRLTNKAMGALGERDQAIIRLHWLEGHSFSDIAEELGMSRTAAKVAACRGYARMRETLLAA